MERGDGYAIAQADELEWEGRWGLVRRSLGAESFGINIVRIEPGKDIPEHDERDRDQEEVYVVLDGDATIVIDGEEHPAPRGTYARIDVDRRRTIRNTGSEPVEVLMVSAPRTSGYRPMSWA